MKITKRQLQNIIAESTKKALNELDWKTYDSAMRKAAKKGQWNRVGKFGNAGRDAFNRDFAHQGHPEDYSYKREHAPYMQGVDKYFNPTDTTWSNDGYYIDSVSLRQPDYDDSLVDRHEIDYRRKPNGTIEHETDIDFDAKDYDDWDYYLKRDSIDGANLGDAMAAAKKGGKETLDYLSGKYKYKKGQGWELNESTLRRIVSESIDNILKY